MVICPQCNIEQNPKEEFCRKCGKFLLPVEDPVLEEEKTKLSLICPRCFVPYKKGNYCRKCGSLLMQGTPSQETNIQPLEKKLVKRWSKEWARLLKEETELESCMSKLKAQRETISIDVIDPIFVRYRERLESLLPLHQEIETELDSIRTRATEEIDSLEKELKPIQKRLEEFQSLYKSSAVRKADFLKEKKELRKKIKSLERSLRKFQGIVSLLPGKMEEDTVSPVSAANPFRPLALITASLILLVILAAGYLFWQRYPQSHEPISKEIATSLAPAPYPTPLPSPPKPQIVPDAKEADKIGSLFDNIRQANLQENIDLFMSCFSRDFNGMEGKRQDTLKMWENFNYLDLSYDLKNHTIFGDTAKVRLEWLVRTSNKISGKSQDGKTLLDVTLKREDGHWRIKEIKQIS